MEPAHRAVCYGVDVGGTKIEAIALAADNGQELARQRITSPRGDYQATITAIRDLVQGLQGQLGAGSVGLGIPGALSPQTGLVKNANSTWLIGHPLGADLEQALGQPVRLANDADCLALSEATDGAAAGSPIAFAVILGTGVGGGVVAHGRVLTGPNAIGGEWGHNPLPYQEAAEHPGPACYCGRHGCIETFLSGPALSADHQRHSGQALTATAIAQGADAGDSACQASLERYSHRLARSLAGVINILDPHTIVLGGGVSNIPFLYQRVPQLWGQWVFSDQVLTALAPSRYGDSSGVRGAAWLWAAENAQRVRAV